METSASISHAAASETDGRMLQRLVERIRRGGCVLVLGPGVAVDPDDPQRTPLTCALARQLATDPDVARVSPRLDANNLRQVAEVFYQSRRDRDELELTVADFYGKYAAATTDFHLALAELPFRVCICTTPDKLIDNAFGRVCPPGSTTPKTPVVAYFSLHHAADRPLPAPTEASPVVYHLYGHVDHPDSLVITENDLIEFLVRVVEDRDSLPDRIRGVLADPETTFLFVGFGFLNWYVRVLLHVLKVYGHKNRPVALEDQSFFSHPEHTQAIMFFSGDRSIEFRPFAWTAFATLLRDTYMAAVRATQPRPAEAPPGAPRAFLCYASEDRAAVEHLSTQLQAGGVAVWQDKQNLRGGDNWDRVLVHVLQRQVDYVVVCQTATMERRVKGYYHKEIELALEQQLQHRPDLRFVIPVTLEPCAGHEKLRHLHFIDVRDDAGVRALVAAILEDWKQRPPPPSGDGP